MTASLSSRRIAELCGPAAQRIALEVVAETGSTNADLLARVDSLPGPALLAAEIQTAGRGRGGRVWHSAAGASLTFSLAWPFNRPIHALVGLPLAVGVVIAETLARYGAECQLKWPNDVLKDGKKLCGILIETTAGKERTWAVIGIGLNMAVPRSLAQQIGSDAAELSQPQLEREALLAALLDGLAQAMDLFESDGFKPFMARWNARHAYAGKPVAILESDKVLHQGSAIGVDPIGRLMLDTAAGTIAIMAGDVSLRTAEK